MLWALLATVVAVATVVVADPADDRKPVFHPELETLEAAFYEAARAIWIDDMPAARAALDRVERACPRYPVEARDRFGATVTNADRAFHAALSAAREYSGAGESGNAFAAFADIQTVCRGCHLAAKEEGRWPDHR
jgi:hypothetical protein